MTIPWLRGQRAQHFLDVGGETDDAVIAVVRPVRFAVPAQVHGDGLPATRGDGGRRLAPGPACLSAAVQEDHGARLRVPEAVSDDLHPAGALDRKRFGCRGHQVILRRPHQNLALA
ncbi:hypothetical protein A5653_15295 [Mycobacterium colombiense]|nr:hypothetical protein A5653_15295 [Mycobacterium colombiense]